MPVPAPREPEPAEPDHPPDVAIWAGASAIQLVSRHVCGAFANTVRCVPIPFETASRAEPYSFEWTTDAEGAVLGDGCSMPCVATSSGDYECRPYDRLGTVSHLPAGDLACLRFHVCTVREGVATCVLAHLPSWAPDTDLPERLTHVGSGEPFSIASRFGASAQWFGMRDGLCAALGPIAECWTSPYPVFGGADLSGPTELGVRPEWASLVRADPMLDRLSAIQNEFACGVEEDGEAVCATWNCVLHPPPASVEVSPGAGLCVLDSEGAVACERATTS